ncbi:MAG: hypothetical protein VCE74_02965 [Alphaproteobacteria bacterium]|jgi:hypothetical protein
MRTLIATLIALMLFATTPVVAGDWHNGFAAYNAGDYQNAFRLLEPRKGTLSAKKAKGELTKLMTPAQIVEAQKLSRELWEKYVVPFQKD